MEWFSKEVSNQAGRGHDNGAASPGTCVGVAGVAVAVAAAGLTGAEGAQLRLRAAVSQSAPLTVLPPVTLRTGALLHPAGWRSGALPRRHQGHVVKVTSTCGRKRDRDAVAAAAAVLLSLFLCLMSFPGVRTSLAVGAADLDGGQIMEKLLEVGVADRGSPGVVGAVVEPEAQREEKNPD